MSYIFGIITQPKFHLYKIIFDLRTSMQHIDYLMNTFFNLYAKKVQTPKLTKSQKTDLVFALYYFHNT